MVAPIRFLSGRQQQQKIGVIGSTEDTKVLEVIGRVGIGSINPTADLDVVGLTELDNLNVSGIATIGTFGVTGLTTTKDLKVTGIATFIDDVNIGTGGTTAFFDVSAGRVGIGTTNPTKTLDVAGYGTSNGIRVGDTHFFAFGDSGSANKGSPTFQNLNTNGNTVLRVLPNGTGKAQFEFFATDYFANAGIGTTTWNNLRIFADNNQGEIRIDTSAATEAGVAKSISIETNVDPGGGTRPNQYQLYLDVNGNVGIGTDAPLQKFQIGAANTLGISTDGKVFTVTSDGSVGIGTTSPTADLDVVGLTELDNLNVSGIATIGTFGVSGLSTTNKLKVVGLSTFESNVDINASVDISNNLTVDGLSDLDELDVAGIATFRNNVEFFGPSSVQLTWDSVEDILKFKDDVAAYFGDGDDLRIFHNGSDSYISDSGTGNIKLISDGLGVVIQKSGTESIANFNTDGSVELYYDNSKKFETTGYGVTVSGGLTVSGIATFQNNVTFVGAYQTDSDLTWDKSTSRLSFEDEAQLSFGDDFDLFIYHTNGDTSLPYTTAPGTYIVALHHDLNISAGSSRSVKISKSGPGSTLALFDDVDGNVELYYQGGSGNGKKFETTGYGVSITGGLNVSGISTFQDDINVSGISTFQDKVYFKDNVNVINDKRITVGTGITNNCLRLYYDTTGTKPFNNEPYIEGLKTNLNIQVGSEKTFRITHAGFIQGPLAQFTDGKGVELYYGAGGFNPSSKKFETTGVGVSIVNGTSDTATIYGPSNLIIDPMPVGVGTTSGVVRIKGDLYVDGTTTQINSTTIELADFVVGIATTVPNDILLDGAGIGIGTNKTFLYEYNSGTNPSLKSSENLNVDSGKHYQIGETEVLSSTTLGSGVIISSLTQVGTISTGVWQGTQINDDYLGTIDNANKVSLSALNIDGGTDIGSTLSDGDLFIVDDGANGTNRKADILGITTYVFGKVSGDILISSTGIATIQENSVGLGTDTFGDYVKSITGTTNEVEVTSGSGEGSTPQIGLPNVVAITSSLTVGSATTITGSGIIAGIVTGTLNNTLTLATFGTGLSGSATYNNSGAATFTVTSNATSANTAGTIVARDGSGNFSAGTITANLTGTATTANNLSDAANITTGTINDARLPDLITSNINISSGISSVATLDATNATIDNLTFTSGTAITSVDTDLTSVSTSDDTLASAKAIKTYVDAQVTAQDLDIQGDTGGALSIDLDSEVLTIAGTASEIETVGSGNTITIGLPNDVTISNNLVVSNDLDVTGIATANIFESTVASGTAPFVVASTTQVTNLNANYLNGYASAVTNTANRVVRRDASGDFSAGTITANLTGTATTATNLADGANITTGTISDDRLPDLITSNINIASGISSVATLDATSATIDNLTFTSGTAITSVDTDLTTVSGSDDTLASAKAIKTYVDAQVTAQDLDFAGDIGTGAVDLDSQSLTISGTASEIETSASGQTLTIGLPNQVAITTSLVVGSGVTITGSTVQVGGNFEVAGTSEFIGVVTFRGGTINIGDSDTDDVVVGGEFASNLVPTTDGLYDLGTSGKQWRDLYITGTIDTDQLNVSGLSTFASNVDINADLDVDGYTELDATNISETLNVVGLSTFGSNVDINADLDVDGRTELDTTNISETLNVVGLSTFGSDVDINASVDISTNLVVDGLSDLDELNVAGISTFASDLDINASVDISNNLVVDGLSDLDELNVAGVSTFQNNIEVTGNIEFDNITTTGAATATLTTPTETPIHTGLSTSTYRSVEYTIQATEGTNFHSAKVLVVHDGTTAYHSEYGTIYNNTPVATFNADVSGGNLRLLAAGESSNSTVYKIHFIATKV